jgi:hypothetical protein
MKNHLGPTLLLAIFTALFVTISCKEVTDHNSIEISDSLEPIEDVTEIEGAQSATLIVEKSNDTYFNLEFQDIEANDIIANGIREGWCIDWQTPINSQGGRYENIRLLSTYRVEKWKPLNYLLNIKDDLLQNDPEMTWQEVQIMIWSLRGYPEFDLNEIPLEDLPSEMTTNGEPNFRYDRVNEMLELIKNNHQKYTYEQLPKFAVIAETPPDAQTVITVVE